MFLGCADPIILFFIVKMCDYWGDLTNIFVGAEEASETSGTTADQLVRLYSTVHNMFVGCANPINIVFHT